MSLTILSYLFECRHWFEIRSPPSDPKVIFTFVMNSEIGLDLDMQMTIPVYCRIINTIVILGMIPIFPCWQLVVPDGWYITTFKTEWVELVSVSSQHIEGVPLEKAFGGTEA